MKTYENIILKILSMVFLRFCNCFYNNVKSATYHKCYVSLCHSVSHFVIPDAFCHNSMSHFVIPDPLCRNSVSHFVIPDALCHSVSHFVIPNPLCHNSVSHFVIPDALCHDSVSQFVIPDALCHNSVSHFVRPDPLCHNSVSQFVIPCTHFVIPDAQLSRRPNHQTWWECIPEWEDATSSWLVT